MDKQSTPVIVGVGQVRHRPELDGEFEAIEPARMMVEALDRAARDAGQPELAKQADYVGTVSPLAWGYADTPAVLADMLGVGPGLRHEPMPGGNSPIELLQHAVRAIQSDDAHVGFSPAPSPSTHDSRPRNEESPSTIGARSPTRRSTTCSADNLQ